MFYLLSFNTIFFVVCIAFPTHNFDFYCLSPVVYELFTKSRLTFIEAPSSRENSVNQLLHSDFLVVYSWYFSFAWNLSWLIRDLNPAIYICRMIWGVIGDVTDRNLLHLSIPRPRILLAFKLCRPCASCQWRIQDLSVRMKTWLHLPPSLSPRPFPPSPSLSFSSLFFLSQSFSLPGAQFPFLTEVRGNPRKFWKVKMHVRDFLLILDA